MSNKLEATFHGETPREIHVWYPLFDNPVRIDMSEEQLALVVEALRGGRANDPGWYEFVANELEGIAWATVDSPPGHAVTVT